MLHRYQIASLGKYAIHQKQNVNPEVRACSDTALSNLDLRVVGVHICVLHTSKYDSEDVMIFVNTCGTKFLYNSRGNPGHYVAIWPLFSCG